MGDYYGYTRVSTETQAEKGGGLEVQRKAIEAYAAEQGIQIKQIFTDAGISGTKESRPALDTLLLETLKEGDTIIVHNTSRLWRDIFTQATIMKSVMNTKAHIVSIDDREFDVYKYMTDPNNFMISGMMGMLDQWERMTIARKLARGRQTKAEAGDKPAGVTPYGYRYSEDRKRIIVDDAEAVTVKKMFTLAQTGQTLSQIADAINQTGTRTRRGKEFSKASISVILSNRFYVGELRHAGQTIKGNHDALISKVQFGKVQAALDRRRRG